jgi:hypothetical protein
LVVPDKRDGAKIKQVCSDDQSGANDNAAQLSVIKHTDLAICLSQSSGQAQCQIAQQYALNVRMALIQLLEIRQVQQIAFHVRISDHGGGTRSAIQQGHFAKSHSGGESGQPLLRAARQRDGDAGATAREKEQFPRRRAELALIFFSDEAGN